jgi:hypothetical protein
MLKHILTVRRPSIFAVFILQRSRRAQALTARRRRTGDARIQGRMAARRSWLHCSCWIGQYDGLEARGRSSCSLPEEGGVGGCRWEWDEAARVNIRIWPLWLCQGASRGYDEISCRLTKFGAHARHASARLMSQHYHILCHTTKGMSVNNSRLTRVVSSFM